MRKKLLIFLLIAVIAMPLMLTACNNKDKVHILTLGDSIAEGIAGMRPVSERERDAYYGIIGIRNGYDFKNRGISGSKSKDLLALIQEEDNGVRMTQTLIRTADIIHISILGNDLLLADIGKLITSVASGDNTEIDKIANTARTNVGQIIEILKAANPDAVMFFQTVYNPVTENSTLITPSSRAALAELGIQPSQYRELSNSIVSKVNAVVHEYLAAHPGAFHLIDGQAEFNRIYNENTGRGKDLVFVDDAHPSAEGHAIFADMAQAKLEEIGLANRKQALKKYKEMRIEQLNRMYTATVDVRAVKKKINKAKSCAEITEIYFDAIEDKMPDYY